MDGENQNVPEKTEPKKSGVRTMISDVQEYASGKNFSLGELTARRGSRTNERPAGFGLENIKPWFYLASAILVLAIIGAGAYLIKRTVDAPAAPALEAPAPLINAVHEETIELETADGREKFFAEWKKLFGLQLLPREFLYVKTFDRSGLEFLPARAFLKLSGANPPPIFTDGLARKSTVGIMDTSRGNEPVFIFEIANHSSVFAGLLQWEEKMPDDLKELLSPDIARDRGENVFHDLVVANNDARFLRNKFGEFVLGYSIFNRRFLIVGQSPQAIEAVIRQMTALPPR